MAQFTRCYFYTQCFYNWIYEKDISSNNLAYINSLPIIVLLIERTGLSGVKASGTRYECDETEGQKDVMIKIVMEILHASIFFFFGKKMEKILSYYIHESSCTLSFLPKCS